MSKIETKVKLPQYNFLKFIDKLTKIISGQNNLDAEVVKIRGYKEIPFCCNYEFPDGVEPKTFKAFKSKYPSIYKWWTELLRKSYDKSYPLYQFFGNRNIGMSEEFLDGKNFCIWCLQNKLTTPFGYYLKYIHRKDKSKDYSSDNCSVITEKELHECSSLQSALKLLWFTRQYDEHKTKGVTLVIAYARYFIHDMDLLDSITWVYTPPKVGLQNFGFSTKNFYASIAKPTDCTYSVYINRIKGAQRYGGIEIRPYEMLNPDFSMTEEALKQKNYFFADHYNNDRPFNFKSRSESKSSKVNYEEKIYSDTSESSVYE